MIYTSGTTGRPKAVRRQVATPEQALQVDAMRRMAYGFEPGMRTVLTAPMYHSAPNSYAIRAVGQGAIMVLMPRFEPEAFLGLVQRHRISHLFMVPTMFIRLLKLPDAVRAGFDPSSLRFVIHAGAPCPSEVKRAMIDWWGPVIHEFYGSTESGAATFCTSAEALARPGTVGRATPGTTLAILDGDGARLPPGAVGEVYTRIAFYPDFTYAGLDHLRREIERDGLITSGDMGYLDADGYLFLCDRKRDMVIVGGVNVYPAEIESALAGMPGVRDSAVFGIPPPGIRGGVDGRGAAAGTAPWWRRKRCRPGWPRGWRRSRCRAPWRSAPSCRARTAARSLSAGCATHTGRRPAARFEPTRPPSPAAGGAGDGGRGSRCGPCRGPAAAAWATRSGAQVSVLRASPGIITAISAAVSPVLVIERQAPAGTENRSCAATCVRTSSPGSFTATVKPPVKPISTCFSAERKGPTVLPGGMRRNSTEKPCGPAIGTSWLRSSVMPKPSTGASSLAWPGRPLSSRASPDHCRSAPGTTRRRICSGV